MMNKSLILLVFMLLVVFSCKEEVVSTKPQFSNIVEAVYASATVQPATSYTVFAESGGMIEQKLIVEGDVVEKGQVLFRIRSTASDLNIENAQLNYELLKDNAQGEANVLKELQNN
ncbi:MAG: efflux RND transporter periplasmic adaptor subunit [Saprospiraceae bacterium]|nr:efflux RND transporter periplasmic adaptor subunit [Saprospiraceae bacterium]